MELCLSGGLDRGWGMVVDMRGAGGEWEMQKRESPDFRFLEVGISATVQKSVILRDVTKSWFSSGYHVTGSNFSR